MYWMRKFLSEANVQAAETIVAVTDDDKVNILASLLAKRNGARQALILLNNMAYSPLVTSLGIDAVISPQRYPYQQFSSMFARAVFVPPILYGMEA